MNKFIEEKKKELIDLVANDPEHSNKELQYVLYNNDTNRYRILFSDDIEQAIEFSDSNDDYSYVPEWDFNFDYYIYYYLDNGYQIDYMKDEVHYSLWNSIHELWPTDIDYEDGVKYYVDYCDAHGITKDYLDQKTGFETPDIMPIFKDKDIEI